MTLLPFLSPCSQAVAFGEALLDLGVTDSYDQWVELSGISANGITRYNAYLSWRELEPTLGSYSFEALDGILEEAAAHGVRIALEIELTDVSCTGLEDSDEECFKDKLPSGLSFSRSSCRFDEERFLEPLKRLVKEIIGRSDPAVLTHLYLGNETDSYLQVVEWASEGKTDLFPSFLSLIRQIQEEVRTLPSPRPKFGTAFKFDAVSGEYHDEIRAISQVVDCMGLTVYPTDPDWGDTLPLNQRIPRWLNTVAQVTGGRPVAITEIGASALSPFGSPESQEEFARGVLRYLKENPGAFEYVTWFSLYDNSPLRGTFFEGTGLESASGERRPAYAVWTQRERGTP